MAPELVRRVEVRRAQVHRIETGRRAVRQRHHDVLPVRREARRKRHAGKIADRLVLARFNVQQRNLRVGVAKRHIGDLLGRRREARRDDKVVAAGEIVDVAAVHIHDGEALAALFGRSRLVDEGDMGIEEALFAGDAGEDRIGDQMRDAARIGGFGRILRPRDLLPGRRVPQAEVGGQMGGVGMQDAAR